MLPEDSLRTRLLFLSELLATAKGSADCKDVPAQSLVLYHALLDAVSDTVLKGFLAVELLSIQLSFPSILTSPQAMPRGTLPFQRSWTPSTDRK